MMNPEEARNAVQFGLKTFSKRPDGTTKPLLAFPKPPVEVQARPYASDATKAAQSAKMKEVRASA